MTFSKDRLLIKSPSAKRKGQRKVFFRATMFIRRYWCPFP